MWNIMTYRSYCHRHSSCGPILSQGGTGSLGHGPSGSRRNARLGHGSWARGAGGRDGSRGSCGAHNFGRVLFRCGISALFLFWGLEEDERRATLNRCDVDIGRIKVPAFNSNVSLLLGSVGARDSVGSREEARCGRNYALDADSCDGGRCFGRSLPDIVVEISFTGLMPARQ